MDAARSAFILLQGVSAAALNAFILLKGVSVVLLSDHTQDTTCHIWPVVLFIDVIDTGCKGSVFSSIHPLNTFLIYLIFVYLIGGFDCLVSRHTTYAHCDD